MRKFFAFEEVRDRIAGRWSRLAQASGPSFPRSGQMVLVKAPSLTVDLLASEP
jgi:hypothetical protein